MQEFFERLDALIAERWDRIKAGPFWQHCLNHPIERGLYRRAMEQIYHYTRYNSINQAAAALRADPRDHRLLRFVYKHAAEELGHENMVVHDLDSIGLLDPALPDSLPLPPTRALIAYLNDVAVTKGPVARLGYSYWAEDSYAHIGEVLGKARGDLGLSDKNLSFFIAHAEIDAGHSKEVRAAIEQAARGEADQTAVLEVAETTLYLTGEVLNAVFEAYREGQSEDDRARATG